MSRRGQFGLVSLLVVYQATVLCYSLSWWREAVIDPWAESTPVQNATMALAGVTLVMVCLLGLAAPVMLLVRKFL